MYPNLQMKRSAQHASEPLMTFSKTPPHTPAPFHAACSDAGDPPPLNLILCVLNHPHLLPWPLTLRAAGDRLIRIPKYDESMMSNIFEV